MSVEKFQNLFSGRNDCYGIYQTSIKESLTKEIYEGHLKGDKRIGIYPIIDKKFTKWLALDIDEDDFAKAVELQNRFKHYELSIEMERSKSKGYHLWLFFDKLIEAVKPRLIAEMIMEEAGIRYEVFPKQDEIQENNYGNFIFLPLFGGDIGSEKTVFLDPNGKIIVKTSEELDLLKITQTKKIEELIKLNNLSREKIEESKTEKEYPVAILPCVSRMQEGKLKEHDGRNEVAFRLSIYFKEKGLSKNIVQVILSDWNLKNIDPLEKEELRTIIESVFKGQYKSYGCEGAIIQKFCNKINCPIVQSQDKKTKIERGIITLTYRDPFSMVFKKLDYEYRLDNIQGIGSPRESISATITLSKETKIICKDQINLSKLNQRKKFVQLAKDPEVDLDIIKIEELIKKQVRKETQEMVKPKQPYLMTESEKNEGLKYLQEHPKVFAEVINATNRMGVAGEESLRLMLYLCFTSRITDNPLSITVKGEASSGKSFICEIMRKLIPEEGYYFITKATQQAFFHLPEDGLQHRIVFISELPGSQAADYSIRTAQTEGDLVLIMPIKNPHTGDIETQTKRVKGPVGFLMTTTQASLFDENETRNFSLYTDDSPELTKKTTEITIQKALGKRYELSPQELNLFKNMQRLLSADFAIEIPFAKEVFSAFPNKPVRIRRDRERFRILIEVITLLHQFHRKQYKKDGRTILEASVADYYLAKRIGEDILLHTIYELGPPSSEVWNAIKHLAEVQFKDINDVEFTYKDIQQITEWKYEKTKKWTLPLLRAGYIEYVEETMSKGGKGKAAKYRISEMYIHRAENLEIIFLPKIQDLVKDYPCNDELFYHPFTGKALDPFTIDAPAELED